MAKFKQKVKETWQKLKKTPKSTQGKAFVRVLQFFAIMIVLTIFARGAAGVTMARVKVTAPYSAEIAEEITATGTVQAQGLVEVEIPAGLTVSKVVASLGSNVKEGDALLEFDTEELSRQVRTEQANLREMQVALRELQNAEGVSTASLDAAKKAVTTAENALNRAREAEDTAYREWQAAVAALENLGSAPSTTTTTIITDPVYDDETSSQISSGSSTTSFINGEEYAQWSEEKDKLEQAVINTKQTYDSAVTTRETAEETLTSAKENLAQEEKSYAQALEKQEIADERNKIAIEKKKMEIEDQQKLIANLQEAQNAGGTLLAPVEGNLSELNVVVGDITSEKNKIQITTNTDGYVVLVAISQENAAKLQVGDTLYVKAAHSWYGSSEAQIVSKFMDPETKTPMLRAVLPGTNWNAGDTVEASVTLSRRQYPTCLPISAVHSGASGSFVYVVEERKTVLGNQFVVVKMDVEVTAQNSEVVALETYLWDVQVITGSSKPLNEGDRVRIDDTVDGV